MTTSICESAPEGSTKRLYDIRDGNKYWITKLKDGNCWMTQNLAYDDSAATVSLPSSWGSDNAARKYYNPGLYVYSAPTNSSNSCGDGNGLKNCTSKGWVDVTGWTASEDSDYAGVIDTTNKIYDAHYLAGNYYSYVSATAGSGGSITSGNVSSSICPTGWQLPENQASTSGTTVVKSYRNLLDNYGWSWNKGSDPSKYSNSLTGTKDSTTYDIRSNPLYFVYSGSINGSALTYAGSQGFYWSSTASGSTYANYLYFDTGVNPSNSYYRYYGMSVRCVAR